MNRFDFYKELYFREIDRRAALSNDVNIPLGIITLMGTVLVFYVTNFEFGRMVWLSVLFVSSLLAGVGFLLYSLLQLLNSFIRLGKDEAYRFVSYPIELEAYRKDILVFNRSKDESESQQIETGADAALNDLLINDFVELTTANVQINDDRSAALTKAKNGLYKAIFFLLFAFIPFAFNFFTKTEKIQQMQIINPTGLHCDSVQFDTIKLQSMANDTSIRGRQKAGKILLPEPPPIRKVYDGKVPETVKERGYIKPDSPYYPKD